MGFDNALISNTYNLSLLTQSNQKSETEEFKDIFAKLSTYRDVINLSWLAGVGDMHHGVLIRDLVRMSERAYSAR